MYKLTITCVQLLTVVLLIDLSYGDSVSEYLRIDNNSLYRIVSCTASCMETNLNNVSNIMFFVFVFKFRFLMIVKFQLLLNSFNFYLKVVPIDMAYCYGNCKTMKNNTSIKMDELNSTNNLCLICRDSNSLTINMNENCEKNVETGMFTNESIAIYLIQLQMNESRSSRKYIHIVSYNKNNFINYINCSL